MCTFPFLSYAEMEIGEETRKPVGESVCARITDFAEVSSVTEL